MQSLSKISGWWVAGMTAVWGCALFGVLQLQNLPIDSQHSVCGPWGCGPPLPPLIAYHGFWSVLLSFPTILVCRGFDAAQLRRFGWIVSGIGFLGLLIVGVWDMIPTLPHWLPHINRMPAKFIVHRYLLAVVTLIDVPIVQITLAGLTCLMTASVRRRRSHDQVWTNDQIAMVFDDVPSLAGKM